MRQQPRNLVIGLGNEHRGDDAIGIVIASRLEGRAANRFNVVRRVSDGLSLIEAWEGADTVIIIDAASSGAAPGTIHRMDAGAEPLGGDFFRYSTHAFGVVEAIELARALGRLPSRVVVYGIEGKSFEAGNEVSPILQKASREVEEMVLADLAVDGYARTISDRQSDAPQQAPSSHLR